MDIRTVSEAYATIAQDLIDTEPDLAYIKDSQVTIVYLSSEHEKRENGRLVFGQCEKVPEKYKWAVPCDFTITIFEPNVERLTDEQIRILMMHELMHIKIVVDGNEEQYGIHPHDVADFRKIIDRFGVDWAV
jgi:predicted metallopeptidase